MDPETTTIKIFGQEYRVRGGEDPKQVEEVAAHVDSRMREVAKGSQQVSSLRIAILAAMNIADDLLRERNTNPSFVRMHERASKLATSLEECLAPESANGDSDNGKGGEPLPDA